MIHAKGIAHRDVKCDNIVLDKCLNLKLVDFEYAQSSKGGLKGVYGSTSYIAPEIISRKAYDEKCDVWSAGVVLYCILFNKMPF